jgi:hypothetical protein
MTDPPIEQLDLLDTDYADILASSNYPALELQLLRLGIDPAKARTTSNFLASRAPKTQYSRTVGCSNRGLGSRLRVRAGTRRFSTNYRIAVEPSKKS